MARWATLRDEREAVAGAQPMRGGHWGVSPQLFPLHRSGAARQRCAAGRPAEERIFMGGEGSRPGESVGPISRSDVAEECGLRCTERRPARPLSSSRGVPLRRRGGNEGGVAHAPKWPHTSATAKLVPPHRPKQLVLVKTCVVTAERDELVVRALLDDPPAFDHEHDVRRQHGREPVGNR